MNTYKDKEVLQELYEVRGLSQREIGEMFGVADTTVSRWCRIHNLDIRLQNREIHPCEECGEPTKNPRFCSSSCSATVNNKIRNRTKRSTCPVCGNEVKRRSHTYCSTECYANHNILKYEHGEFIGSGRIKGSLRAYIFSKVNNMCELCGFSGENPVTRNSILELHHIDGDRSNNQPNNHQVLCPNCHAMTPTFRSLNKTSS